MHIITACIARDHLIVRCANTKSMRAFVLRKEIKNKKKKNRGEQSERKNSYWCDGNYLKRKKKKKNENNCTERDDNFGERKRDKETGNKAIL